MRGSVSITEAYNLTPVQRKFIFELIKNNAEMSKKTGNPIY